MSNNTQDYNKVAHLGFIQAVITRLAQNSFLVRGWLVVILLGSLAASEKIGKIIDSLPVFYFGLIVIFWTSDSYFLYQEKGFRSLYDRVNDNIYQNYSLKLDRSDQTIWHILKSFFSVSLFIFYIPLISLITLLTI